MVICPERGADLHTAQLTPLPLTVSCFCRTQIDFTFLVPAHLGSHGKGAIKRLCVCCMQIIICLCDAFSRPQYAPSVRHSPRKSPSFTPKVTGASGSESAAGDAEPDAETSDVDVRFTSLPRPS